EWTHALAHELAHYLFFLPDNYLGFKGQNDNILGRVVCPNSFMTSTSDPSYTELLTLAEWQSYLACQNTLANRTTGRADWETVTAFYPMLHPPTTTLNGPTQLPLAITRVLPWAFVNETPPLAARNFDIRNEADERLRLPDAQAYLFKTHDPADATDDILIPLGNPTGGGDRLKVRGAEDGDRLCLLNTTATQIFYGCEEISPNQIDITPQTFATVWEPTVTAQAVTSQTIAVSVTLASPLSETETLVAQLFPQHYRTQPCIAPHIQWSAAELQYTAVFTLPLPAYEVTVDLWTADDNGQRTADSREFISHFRLNWPENSGSANPSQSSPCNPPDPQADQLEFSPIIGGEITTLNLAPNAPVAGPSGVPIGGPNYTGIGGPNYTGIGGPNYTGIGGPNYTGIGGASNFPAGNPNYTGIGGP
ncbi:MAG: hypothetical protein KDE51_24205, partial [Anaerolineales bacterium]|nr:hypothetical protein [Anaerolineales bacterium]